MQKLAAAVNIDLGSLFEREGDRIFAFLLARSGSRAVAEDLTAETFLAASSRYAAGAAHEVSRSWLFTVARRRLIDHWRSQAAQGRRLDRLRSEAHRVADLGDPTDTGVAEALDSLPDRQRAALMLRYLDEFSVSEVADALDLSYKAAESLLGRARVAFATAFENREPPQ